MEVMAATMPRSSARATDDNYNNNRNNVGGGKGGGLIRIMSVADLNLLAGSLWTA